MKYVFVTKRPKQLQTITDDKEPNKAKNGHGETAQCGNGWEQITVNLRREFFVLIEGLKSQHRSNLQNEKPISKNVCCVHISPRWSERTQEEWETKGSYKRIPD